MSRYLVTGGAGFIGSHLVDALLAAGHQVRVADDLSTGSRANLPPAAELMVVDLREPAAAAELVAGMDGVFHLAAIASVARCNEAWADSHRVNLGATIALFDAARRQPRLVPVVYASSAAVYGDPAGSPVGEDLPMAPLGPYGADKAGCELHARAAAHVHGVASFGLRFFNVYGPRQRPDDAYSGVIAAFAGRIAAGRPLTIHGDGRQTRDFVFVLDIVLALSRAMADLQREPGPAAKVANVATGRGTSILELATLLQRLIGNAVPVTHGPSRVGDIRSSVGATRELERVLGFTPATTLASGLAQTL